jgi:hypothetical protein
VRREREKEIGNIAGKRISTDNTSKRPGRTAAYSAKSSAKYSASAETSSEMRWHTATISTAQRLPLRGSPTPRDGVGMRGGDGTLVFVGFSCRLEQEEEAVVSLRQGLLSSVKRGTSET